MHIHRNFRKKYSPWFTFRLNYDFEIDNNHFYTNFYTKLFISMFHLHLKSLKTISYKESLYAAYLTALQYITYVLFSHYYNNWNGELIKKILTNNTTQSKLIANLYWIYSSPIVEEFCFCSKLDMVRSSFLCWSRYVNMFIWDIETHSMLLTFFWPKTINMSAGIRRMS